MDPREQIKSKIDIVQFIAEYIPLKQMGRNFKTLCPFHGEKTPSFVVSPERQIWHCFGCNLGGDCFTFLMEFEKMDFVEALRTLAKRTGVKLTHLLPGKTGQEREKLLAINHLASEFYHYLLTSHKIGGRALTYLAERGINRKTIETFKLGFVPDRWDLLLNFLTKKKGFTESDLEQAGLVIRTKNQELRTNNLYYDRFRNRIMFTLADHRGNIVGFAGRLLDPHAKEAKYVNTPETLLYHKGELFFGLDVTKEAIKKENQAIIVEGEFDMLQSFQAGVANVVALKGTALTDMQARLIRRYTQHIALAFDVDLAGDQAARRGIEVVEREGLNMKVVALESGKDPDEAIRKAGPAAWKKAIANAVGVFDFLINSAVARHDLKTPEGKKEVAQEVLPPIARINNEIVKAHYIKRLAGELDVAEETVIKQMGKVESVASSSTSKASDVFVKQDRKLLLEEYLLALLLQKADYATADKVYSLNKGTFLTSPILQRILALLITFYKKDKQFTIASFVKELSEELIPTVDRLYLLDTEPVKPENVASEAERVIRELRMIHLRREMQALANALQMEEQAGEDKTLLALQKQFSLLSSKLAKL